MSDEKAMNKKIREYLIQIIDLLSNNDTKANGLEKYHMLITDNIKRQDKLTFIIHIISEIISKSPIQTKKECALTLLLQFIQTFPTIEASYPFVSRILTTIQSNIFNLSIENISSFFLSIIKLLFNKNSSEDDQNLKHNFQLFQGFCLYNMKQNEADCQVCGASCLSILINNCFYFFEEKYLKYIWEKIITFLDSKDYEAKYILLNCLGGLLKNIKQLFRAYAIVTLYKVIDFLAEEDIQIKREALNVVYLLVLYCKTEVSPLKDQIIDFIEGMISDEDKDIRQKCMLIFKEYNIGNSFAKQMKSKQLQQKQRQKQQIATGYVQPSQKDNGKLKPKQQIIQNQVNNNQSIKMTPNNFKKHSIFKTNPNSNFFKRAKNENEILVIDYFSSSNNDNRIKDNDHNRNTEENKEEIKAIPHEISYNKEEEHENFVITTYAYKDDSNTQTQLIIKPNDDLDQLLSQIKALNHNQMTLLDTVTSIQSELNQSLTKLFNKVDELELIYDKQPHVCTDHCSLIEALDNDDIQLLITLLIDISLDDLKEIQQPLIDKTLNKLLTSLNDIHSNKGQKPYIEIALIKKIVIGSEISLSPKTSSRIIEELAAFLKINQTIISNEDKVDISLIQSYLNFLF